MMSGSRLAGVVLLAAAPGYFERHYSVVVQPELSRRDTLELLLERDPAGVPPRHGAFVSPTTAPLYPPAARAASIQGTVRLGISADGALSILSGSPELAEVALTTARRWKISEPDPGDELRFVYTLAENDCLGGGPTVTRLSHREFEIAIKRVFPCGGLAAAGR